MSVYPIIVDEQDHSRAPILILGIGNILLTDEGVGIKAIKELQKRYTFSDEVEILDGGTAGIELLNHIRHRRHLIIIDAMRCDHPPGTFLRISGNDVPAAFMTRISPHQLGLSDLLAAAILTEELPDNVVLFGVEPDNLEPGLELSEKVEMSLDTLLQAVTAELQTIGCRVKQRPTYLYKKEGALEAILAR